MHLRDYETNGKLTGVRLEKLAKGRRHHFNERMVAKYEAAGLITKNDKTLTMHTIDGDMEFAIDHPPTRVCLLCGEHLPNEDRTDGGQFIPQGDIRLGAGARKHMDEKHKGEKSPDPQFPYGYKYKKYWGCEPHDSVPTINPNCSVPIIGV